MSQEVPDSGGKRAWMGPTVLTQYWIDQAELVQYYGKITIVSQLTLRLWGGLLCGSSGSGSGSGGSVYHHYCWPSVVLPLLCPALLLLCALAKIYHYWPDHTQPWRQMAIQINNLLNKSGCVTIVYGVRLTGMTATPLLFRNNGLSANLKECC